MSNVRAGSQICDKSGIRRGASGRRRKQGAGRREDYCRHTLTRRERISQRVSQGALDGHDGRIERTHSRIDRDRRRVMLIKRMLPGDVSRADVPLTKDDGSSRTLRANEVKDLPTHSGTAALTGCGSAPHESLARPSQRDLALLYASSRWAVGRAGVSA